MSRAGLELKRVACATLFVAWTKFTKIFREGRTALKFEVKFTLPSKLPAITQALLPLTVTQFVGFVMLNPGLKRSSAGLIQHLVFRPRNEFGVTVKIENESLTRIEKKSFIN